MKISLSRIFGFASLAAIFALLALTSLDSVPQYALADAPTAPVSSAAPVTINSCGPLIDKNQTQNVMGLQIPVSTSSGIQIEFVNESNQAAKLVNFAVDSAGDHFVIRDVGTFSPGVSIKHRFRNGTGQAFILPAFISPNVKCHVASVEFADGTVWRVGQTSATTAPVAPAAGPVSLSVNPTSVNVESTADSQLFLVTSSARVSAFKETDDCGKVASIFVAATGDASATYSVKPIAVGSCTARVTDEAGNSISVPITVR